MSGYSKKKCGGTFFRLEESNVFPCVGVLSEHLYFFRDSGVPILFDCALAVVAGEKNCLWMDRIAFAKMATSEDLARAWHIPLLLQPIGWLQRKANSWV